MAEQIVFTLYKSPNLDLAMAEAVLSGLGLKTAQMRQEFISTYGYGDLMKFFKERVNAPANAKTYTNIIKEVKKHGKTKVSFGVAGELVKDIKEFLAMRENKFSARVKDAGKQMRSSAGDAVAGADKNLRELIGNLDRGAGRAAGGLWNSLTAPVGSERFRAGLGEVRDGFYEYETGLFKLEIQTPLDAFLTLVGGEIDARQTLLGIENIGRSLNTIEKQILSSVFGSSLVLEAIIIKEGYAGIYNAGDNHGLTLTNNQRAITRGNTIYMKNEIVGSSAWNNTLVHEATHVWQNHNGGTDYISEALHAQTLGVGYKYEDAIFIQKKTWAMLNPEQQGQLVQDAYDAGFFTVNKGQWLQPVQGSNQKINRPDLTQFMQGVLPQLLAGQGAT